jgi:hypothetical protein
MWATYGAFEVTNISSRGIPDSRTAAPTAASVPIPSEIPYFGRE